MPQSSSSTFEQTCSTKSGEKNGENVKKS